MKTRSNLGLPTIFSGLSLLASITLFVIELILYSRAYAALPQGLSLGSVPVGGLSEAAALEQLVTAYRTPEFTKGALDCPRRHSGCTRLGHGHAAVPGANDAFETEMHHVSPFCVQDPRRRSRVSGGV